MLAPDVAELDIGGVLFHWLGSIHVMNSS